MAPGSAFTRVLPATPPDPVGIRFGQFQEGRDIPGQLYLNPIQVAIRQHRLLLDAEARVWCRSIYLAEIPSPLLHGDGRLACAGLPSSLHIGDDSGSFPGSPARRPSKRGGIKDPVNFRQGVAKPAISSQLAVAARFSEPSADRYEGRTGSSSLNPAVVAAAEGFVRGAGIGGMSSGAAVVFDALQNPAHPTVGGKVVVAATPVGGVVGLAMAVVDHVWGKGQPD